MEMYFLVIKVVKGDKDLVFFRQILKKKFRKKAWFHYLFKFRELPPLATNWKKLIFQ